jgi:hypothetical protein
LREDDARYNLSPVDPSAPRMADHLSSVSSAELLEWMENSRLRRGAGVVRGPRARGRRRP